MKETAANIKDPRQTGRGDRGAAILEAAITIFAFMALLFGCIEASRIFHIEQTLTNAAREGARLSVTPESRGSTLPSQDEITAEVQRFLATAGITDADITVEAVVEGGDELTRVSASVPYQFLTLTFLYDGSLQLTGSALMRNETSP